MRRRAPITVLLIAANLVAFVYEMSRVGQDLAGGGGSMDAMVAVGALVPALVTQGEYWRIITGGFLHASLIHLAANMYSLYNVGRFVEIVAGSPRMATIYGVSLIGSGLAVAYLASPYDVTVGASGAIFGLLGALFAIGFKHGRAGMQFVRANLNVLLLNLVITFAVPGISRWGHIGGLVVGFVVTWVVYTPPRVPQYAGSPSTVERQE